MSDKETRVEELRQVVRRFCDERDWNQFHDPKNLAEAGVIEAGELLEHFLWKTKEEVVAKWRDDATYRQEVADELADVLGYVLQMADALDIDLSEALRTKYKKNELKYPVEKSKGNNAKYTKL